MSNLTKHEKAIGAAVAVWLLFLAVLLVYQVFRGPSPEEARAALAEAGRCEPDEPIVSRDGSLFIGDYRCDLAHSVFSKRKWPEGHFYREHSRWVARPRLNEPYE